MRILLGGVVLGLAACAHAPADAPAQAAPYAVDASWNIGGEGRWDLLAVDEANSHLFLSRGDHVDVVDTRTGQRVGAIAGTDGVHGIAIAPGLHRGFATNGRANTVTEFDLGTLQRIVDIPLTGQSPDATVFDASSQRLFVMNAKSNNASVIDPASGKEVGTIAFEGNPELAVVDGKGHLFVNIEDKAQLVELDSKTMRILQTWPLQGCEEPSGLAMDTLHARLFSVCQNKTMAITDANTGRQVARVAIDDGPDGAAFDEARQMAFSSNGKSGTLTIVHEDDPEHFHVAQSLATQASARTVTIDPASHRLYLPAARFAPQAPDAKGRPPMVADSFSVVVVGTPADAGATSRH